MRSKFFLAALITGYCLLVSACVPSPTATPPRQTPFPTLPLVDETATPSFEATFAVETPNAPSDTTPPPPPPTDVPLPTLAAQQSDTFAPVAQLIVQDPELPVSAEQPVALNVLAADDSVIARLEVYDNDVLFARANVVIPSPVYSHQFIWKTTIVGKHTLRAIAYDTSGNASAPAQIELNVINNNRAPNVQITAPQGSKDAELGAPILIQGVATDDVAVTRVELLVDNQLVTFVTPERAGVTPFAVAIPWTPQKTGAHSIVLRAYDNQGQSDDSLRYTIRVFDNDPPVVNATSDHTLLAPGDVLMVRALALSNNGVARVELYVDGFLADTVNSASPAQQTALQTFLTAADLAEGAHTFFVRAHDLTGQNADTPRVSFELRADAPRVPRETRTPPSTPTRLPPTPTATPELVLPGPPTIDLELVNAPVVLPNAAQIEIRARGTTELDQLQVWARAPGETSAQLVLQEVLKGSVDKTLTLTWNAPRAGVVEMYARVTDNLKQARLSVPLRFSVHAPPAPTPPPAIFDFARAWYAESPAARFELDFMQIGRALRGTFLEQRADGAILKGTIVNGAANERAVTFGVTFAPETHHLDFDCSFNARPPVLTCNYENENGERGSAVFQALEQ